MAAVSVPRGVSRTSWPVEVRLSALETDADETESAMAALDRRISKLMTISVSTFVSTFTAVLLLVVDIISRVR